MFGGLTASAAMRSDERNMVSNILNYPYFLPIDTQTQQTDIVAELFYSKNNDKAQDFMDTLVEFFNSDSNEERKTETVSQELLRQLAQQFTRHSDQVYMKCLRERVWRHYYRKDYQVLNEVGALDSGKTNYLDDKFYWMSHINEGDPIQKKYTNYIVFNNEKRAILDDEEGSMAQLAWVFRMSETLPSPILKELFMATVDMAQVSEMKKSGMLLNVPKDSFHYFKPDQRRVAKGILGFKCKKTSSGLLDIHTVADDGAPNGAIRFLVSTATREHKIVYASVGTPGKSRPRQLFVRLPDEQGDWNLGTMIRVYMLINGEYAAKVYRILHRRIELNPDRTSFVFQVPDDWVLVDKRPKIHREIQNGKVIGVWDFVGKPLPHESNLSKARLIRYFIFGVSLLFLSFLFRAVHSNGAQKNGS